MNLRSIDLNLLVILDALLDEAHVSRAAHRLGLTQPAVSAALQRCRTLLGDELLLRGRGTMRRTARAEALRCPLKALLADVHALVDPPDVPLREIERTIRLIVSDNVAALLLPALLTALQEAAPGIDLVIRPWVGAAEARAELLSGDADLALSVFNADVDGLERRQVLDERYVVAMRRDHSAAMDFSLERWLAWPHILVSSAGQRRGPVDSQLEAMGHKRHVGLVVPSFQLVPGVLLATDFLAMLPAHSIPTELADALAVHAPPVPIAGFTLHLAWASRAKDDKVLRHVVDLLSELLAATCPALATAD